MLFGLLALTATPLAFLLPWRSGRWRVARVAARLVAGLTGTPIVVHGLEQLRITGPLILVANHQSYLDSFVLMAALPVRFSFVAKAELAASVVLRRVLKRLDVVFVERFDSRQAIEDTRWLKDLAATGQSLLFFAEGTFRRMPGLLPFHMGAFLIAAENNMEVVPITIRGTIFTLSCITLKGVSVFLARVAAVYRFVLLSHWLILEDKISGMIGLVM